MSKLSNIALRKLSLRKVANDSQDPYTLTDADIPNVMDNLYQENGGRELNKKFYNERLRQLRVSPSRLGVPVPEHVHIDATRYADAKVKQFLEKKLSEYKMELSKMRDADVEYEKNQHTPQVYPDDLPKDHTEGPERQEELAKYQQEDAAESAKAAAYEREYARKQRERNRDAAWSYGGATVGGGALGALLGGEGNRLKGAIIGALLANAANFGRRKWKYGNDVIA